jgi:hypothetical protein
MSKAPTAAQRRRMSRAVEIGCILEYCRMPAVVHHCVTGSGGRRDHDKIIPLCPRHHAGYGNTVSFHDGRKVWQEIHGTEKELMEKLSKILGE